MKKYTATGLVLSLSLFCSAAKAENNAYYQLQPLEVREVIPTTEELYSDAFYPSAYDLPHMPDPGTSPVNPMNPSLPTPVNPNGPSIPTIPTNPTGPTIPTIPGRPGTNPVGPTTPGNPINPGKPVFDIGNLLLIGQKIIDIIVGAKPVVNVHRDFVAVIPGGLTSWTQLGGWQMPKTKVYSVVAKNGLGMKVVDLRVKVSTNYGGNLNGVGQFLANVIVVPTSINVLLGFNCDVWTEHQDPLNMGTPENPIAGLGFDLRFRYGSVLNENNSTQDFFVTGTGEIKQIE